MTVIPSMSLSYSKENAVLQRIIRWDMIHGEGNTCSLQGKFILIDCRDNLSHVTKS